MCKCIGYAPGISMNIIGINQTGYISSVALLKDGELVAAAAEERFTRMTNQRDHYYSYLYAGLYIKQMMNQWKVAGFDIAKKPEVVSTLYNIGFSHSVPKNDPKSGGAKIEIGDYVYSFGSLGAEFYNSNELLEEFPR